MAAHVESFFDEATFTVSHVVSDPATGKCVIIDPVLDYCAASGRTGTKSADAVIEYINENNLAVDWIFETHVHADHISAAPYLKEKTGGKTAIGDAIPIVQKAFGEIFNEGADFARDGSQFDKLFGDDETFELGALQGSVIHTPGHTPACITIIIDDAAFVGDTLFMPDYGTARCDFPGGDARKLYRSIQRMFALPPATRLFMCHDYKAPGRDHFAWEASIEEQKSGNIHIGDGISEDEFVVMRETRDKDLNVPKLLLPAVQVNMRAGKWPPKESNGVSYLKLPVDAF